ncbi:MAG: flavodoxin family protein [Proteobacteria bacterium]|nr:flavodoxin family protein [Pseudomonadota bacterium]
MKVLGICGSFRDESNTNKLVKKVVDSCGCDSELIYLAQADIKPCTGCAHCMMNDGECIIKDGMQDIYEKLLKADALVFGAPTYFLDVSGAAKCFIDRNMALYYRGIGPDAEIEVLGKRPLAGRPAVAITTVAGGGHERTIETLKLFLDYCHKMKIVAEIAEPVGMNDVHDMPDVMKRAEEAGKRLAAALRK